VENPGRKERKACKIEKIIGKNKQNRNRQMKSLV